MPVTVYSDPLTSSPGSPLAGHITPVYGTAWAADPAFSNQMQFDGTTGIGVYSTGSAFSSFTNAVVIPADDYCVSADFLINTLSGQSGLTIRNSLGINGGVWGFVNADTGVLSLAMIGGATLASYTPPIPWVAGQTIHLDLAAQGTNFTLAADGVQVLSFNVPSISTTAPGRLGVASQGVAGHAAGITAVNLVCGGLIQVRTTPDGILRSMSAAIAGGVYNGVIQNLTTTNIFITLYDDPFPFAGGPFVAIKPGGQVPDQQALIGMGRRAHTMEGSFTVSVGDLSMSDQADRDTVALTRLAANLYLTATAVIDIFTIEFLYSPTGDQITEEPMRLVGGIGKPRPHSLNESNKMVSMYRVVDIGFSAVYPLALTIGPND